MKIKELKNDFEKLTEEKARIVAHLMGDGAIYKSNHDYFIKYEVKDEDSLKSFADDLEKIYGLKLTHGTNPSGKTGQPIPLVYLRSKLAYEDLMTYGRFDSENWEVGSKILNSDLEIKREFLKAFFDDEGSVVPAGKKAIIRLYSINSKGLDQIQTMLKEFGIDSKMQEGYGARRNVFALIIKDLKLFKENVGFNLKRKQERLNGFIK